MKVFLVILAILVVLFIVIYTYYGGFTKVSFRIENQGGEIVVYENLTGDYSQSGNSLAQAGRSTENYVKVKSNGNETKKME